MVKVHGSPLVTKVFLLALSTEKRAFSPVISMSEESTRRALSPPTITDASDDDKPDEIIQLLGQAARSNWPDVNVDVTCVKTLTEYGVRLANRKVLKSVLLAVVAGASAIAYTYILLSVR